MPSKNSEDDFESLPQTPDQALRLLLTDTHVIGFQLDMDLVRIHSVRVAAVNVQPITK